MNVNFSTYISLINLFGLLCLSLHCYKEHGLRHLVWEHDESIRDMKEQLSKVSGNDDHYSVKAENHRFKEPEIIKDSSGYRSDLLQNENSAQLHQNNDGTSSKIKRKPIHNYTRKGSTNSSVNDIFSKSVSKSTQRKAQQISSRNISTSCRLINYSNSAFVQSVNKPDPSESLIDFNLDLKLRTNRLPYSLSWYLSSRDDVKELIINSRANESYIELQPETLYNFEYHCSISTQGNSTTDELYKGDICYDFSMSEGNGFGNCCYFGVGYFSLKVNDFVTSESEERFYSHTSETSFCVGDNSSVIQNNDKHRNNTQLLYPSRECLNEICVCDSNPELFSDFVSIESDYDGLYELRRQARRNIIFISGSNTLFSFETPQYKAACWVLYDDPYLIQYNTSTTYTEKRMIQRYILAVFYFATKPGNWSVHLNFLSSMPECEWHVNAETFFGSTSGVSCDTNDNIVSLLFDGNNLEGSIVGEISGLRSLESLWIGSNDLVHNTIPSSLGNLSKLKSLFFMKTSIEGTIPLQLFNATKMESLVIENSKITGTIPEAISNLQGLQNLRLGGNYITGSIPKGVFSLRKLRVLFLSQNQLSQNINPSIYKLELLESLDLDDNNLSGTLPLELGLLSNLKKLHLGRNKFQGGVPYTFASLSSIGELNLVGNMFKGQVPDEICENNPVPLIVADCRNDIFPPDLSCSCCSYCSDKSPVWNEACPDSKLKFVLDHVLIQSGRYSITQWSSTEGIEWSITDTLSRKKVLAGGPYIGHLTEYEPYYENCIASSDRFSFNMMSDALINIRPLAFNSPIDFNTNYSIYWNDKLVLRDTFKINYNTTAQAEVTFQYNATTDEIQIDDSPVEIVEITCGAETQLLKEERHRLMYNTAIRVSGTQKLKDPKSPQSRAICWIINDKSEYHQSAKYTALMRQFTQRYIFTLFHLTSKNGLFGDKALPPSSHECEWIGLHCAGGKNIVTKLSLSSAANQIIGGTLIEEIGNLAFLEILNLSQTELKGTIPHVFSNLYSLKELDLSGNALTGTIPTEFFNQLGRLEVLDLSDNDMTGIIPTRIGSHSNIEVIRLNNNRFTGELPLDGFANFNLKHLDVSENKLSGSISPTLLKHMNIENINFGNNVITGKIMENLLNELINLKYFNVSKNELTGAIPPFYHNVSNITHFDMHMNRITGTLPLGFAHMQSLEHLNLQGNRIVGSIPFELNNLKTLELLALSHNQLIGSIPLEFEELPRLNRVYLHANRLRGDAPPTDKTMEEYITDCGEDEAGGDFVICSDCTKCCNSENSCIGKNRLDIRSMYSMFIFAVVFIIMVFCYTNKKKIMRTRLLQKFFQNNVQYWQASDLIGKEKTVYHYFLTDNKVGWLIALITAALQLATLFLFVRAADVKSNDSDVQYTMVCPKNSFECTDTDTRTFFGYVIFTLIITAWLLRDIVSSIKLFLLSMWKKNIDFFFASTIVLFVTLFSVSTSIYYNIAIASADTDMIYDAVILLFVNELDERLYLLAESFNDDWVYDVDQSLQRQSYLEKKQLIIYRGFHKVKKRIHSLKDHFHSGHQLHEGEEICKNTKVENTTSNLDNTLESAKAS